MELESERRKSSTIPAPEILWNLEYERLREELSRAVVSLECAKKVNEDHMSIYALKNFPCEAENLEGGGRSLTEKKWSILTKDIVEFDLHLEIAKIVTTPI